MAETMLLPAYIRRDLRETLARLRQARTIGDDNEARVTENRLNWLIETKLKRKDA